MKACKIILIALLIIKTFKEIITTLNNMVDSQHPLEDLIASLIVIGITWSLYYGAGILDV
jgi:hypothetical protein